MAEKRGPLKFGKVEVRPAGSLLKIVLIILIAFSMAALIALRWVHNGILDQTAELKDEAAAIEHANQELEERKKDPTSFENIQQIAQEELGLVDPDTIIIDPQ